MQITSEPGDGCIKYKITMQVKYNLTAPNPYAIVDGVYVPMKIINQDLIMIGKLLVHRSALEEGGWHEYDISKFVGGTADI